MPAPCARVQLCAHTASCTRMHPLPRPLRTRVAPEGGQPREQDVQAHPQRPDVCEGAYIYVLVCMGRGDAPGRWCTIKRSRGGEARAPQTSAAGCGGGAAQAARTCRGPIVSLQHVWGDIVGAAHQAAGCRESRASAGRRARGEGAGRGAEWARRAPPAAAVAPRQQQHQQPPLSHREPSTPVKVLPGAPELGQPKVCCLDVGGVVGAVQQKLKTGHGGARRVSWSEEDR